MHKATVAVQGDKHEEKGNLQTQLMLKHSTDLAKKVSFIFFFPAKAS